jgi:hypothetical protein
MRLLSRGIARDMIAQPRDKLVKVELVRFLERDDESVGLFRVRR